MPPLKPVPGVIKLRLHYTIGSDATTGTGLHFQYAGTAPSNTVLTDWVTQAESSWRTHVAILYTATTTLTLLEATDLTTTSSGYGKYTTNTVGLRTGTTVPASTPYNLGYQVATRYRGGKGRSYWPFGAEADSVSAQLWSAQFNTDAYNGVVSWIQDITGTHKPAGITTMTHCIVSYYSRFDDNGAIIPPDDGKPKPRPNPKIYPVVAYLGDVRFGAQRRRVK